MSEWTTERHAAVKARCDAATPGPWAHMRQNKEGRDVSRGTVRPEADDMPALAECCSQTTKLGERGAYDWESNAAFIAEARADLPDALAEIERLGNILDRVAMADDSPRTWSGYCRYCDTHMSERPDHREDCRWMATRNKSQP